MTVSTKESTPLNTRLRVFKNPLLEATTLVHPVIPVLLWLPIISFIISEYEGSTSWSTLLLLASSGLITWTFSEYFLHRYVFHYPAKSRFGQYLVFLFHDIHHKHPDDSLRLLMPPVPAIGLASIFFALFYALLGEVHGSLLFAFFMCGYLCYDYIHYATHHHPCKNRILKALKIHHMRHHHLTPQKRFGVSSPLWDYIFKT